MPMINAVEVLGPKVHFSPCGIDFVQAADSHMKWRNRLLSHIEGGVWRTSPSEASADDCCGLGRWLRGIGRVKYGNFSSFRYLDVEHAEFHQFAGMILGKVQEGDLLGAEALLKNEFSQATRRILMAMNELNDVMQQVVQSSAGVNEK